MDIAYIFSLFLSLLFTVQKNYFHVQNIYLYKELLNHKSRSRNIVINVVIYAEQESISDYIAVYNSLSRLPIIVQTQE